jgi:formylmethanofuran dehydrogenase subunit E-like metal-binding protein
MMIVWFILATAASAAAKTDVRQMIAGAVKDLGVEKGNVHLCTLTDATYVKIHGKTTESYVDMIQEETGCSVGKGNLLFFHRPADYPLLVAIHREDTGQAVAIKYDGNSAETVRFNLKGDTAADPKHYGGLMKALKADAFSIATILTSRAKGAPYDFLKCTEYHNHYCPGVTSGYFIARLIMDKYPLKGKEQYIWFACPPWCKDDAVSTMLDLTPGKRSLFVKELAEGQPSAGEKGRWAGIMVIWNGQNKSGRALALQYDGDEAYRVAGLTAADFKPKGGKSNPAFFTARVKSAWSLIPHLEKPERFISVVKEVDITSSDLNQMKMAGGNPYQVIGVTQ